MYIICVNYPCLQEIRPQEDLHPCRCTFHGCVYSHVPVFLSLTQMTRCTPQRFCRVHSLHAGCFPETYFSEARVSCLCEREERKEIARERERERDWNRHGLEQPDSLSYPLDIGLCALKLSRESSLSPPHVQTRCHFYFAKLLYSRTGASLKREV